MWTKTTLTFSFQLSPLCSLTLYCVAMYQTTVELGCIWGCVGHSGACVHQAWFPSYAAEAGLKWVCVTSGITVRGQAGGWVGRVYTNASWQCGLFPSNTQVHIHYIYTKTRTNTCSCCVLLLNSLSQTHSQNSSWHCRKAASDEIKWGRGTSLLCYKELHAVTLCECCSTS